MDSFNTSYCRPLNLSINVEGRGLIFRDLPQGRSFDRFLVRLVDRGNREAASGDFMRGGMKYISTEDIPDGKYTLQVFHSTPDIRRFRGYLENGEAIIRINGGRPSFCEPWPLRDNISVTGRFSCSSRTRQELLREEDSYPCRHHEIRRIASVITAGIEDNYGKMLAVHDWVAENVFYDEDSIRLINGAIGALPRSTMEVLKTRRAVCLGYSDLAVALLRASGIPSVTLSCFALGQGTRGGWECPENRINSTNHAFTAALMGHRYVLMDITWDSDNVYSGRQYHYKTGFGRSRKFFDMSALLLSASHRLIDLP